MEGAVIIISQPKQVTSGNKEESFRQLRRTARWASRVMMCSRPARKTTPLSATAGAFPESDMDIRAPKFTIGRLISCM